MSEQLTEATGTVLEAADAGAGRYRVVTLTVGKGSSGVYPRETLIEAANKRLIRGGTTFAYLDHPTATEAHDRPERSVRDLAGVFTTDAVWSEEHNGLVADLQVFAPYRELIGSMAEHIGLSIRGDGEIEMREGQRTVTSLAHIESVDFVTRAGRGGKVLSVLESARTVFDASDMAAVSGVPNDVPVTPAGQPDEPSDVSVDVAESTHETPKEAPVAELSEAEVAALRSSVTEAEAARDAALARADTAEQALAEASARQAARPAVIGKVAESKTLGPRTQARLVESVLAALPVTGGKVEEEDITKAVTAAVQAAEAEAADYIRRGTTVGPLFGSYGSAQESGGEFEPLAESDFVKAMGVPFGQMGA